MAEMSELKEIQGVINGQQFDLYFKDEADKVIAELEDCIRDYSENEENLVIANLDMQRRERHNKYKRCLAKAKWCEERIARIEKDYAFWRYGKDYASNFYKRWKKRWLELAEQFNEAK